MAKAKQKSRWQKRSGVPRYDKDARKILDEKFPAEKFGWRNGAKVSRR